MLGSKNVTDKKMHVFLTKQLDGTPIAEMSENPTYIFFYPNTSSTFAPAAMVNRNTYANVSTTPIVNDTDVNSLLSTIYYADTKEPYVSLYLKTTLDESTRELNVKLYVLPHKTMPHTALSSTYTSCRTASKRVRRAAETTTYTTAPSAER